jgi:hypothetical protein
MYLFFKCLFFSSEDGNESTSSPRPSGLLSPGGPLQRQKSSPRVSLNDNDIPPLNRSRRPSGTESSSAAHPDQELTPPYRINPIRLPLDVGAPFPSYQGSSNSSGNANNNANNINNNQGIARSLTGSGSALKVTDLLQNDSNSIYKPDMQSSLSGSSDNQSFLDSSSIIQQQKNVPGKSAGLLLSSVSNPFIGSSSSSFYQQQQQGNQQSISNMNSNTISNSALPSISQSLSTSNHQIMNEPLPSKSPKRVTTNDNNLHFISQEEFNSYFQAWKCKEDYYVTEIGRLKEEILRLKSITKPFLSTIAVLLKNQPEQVIDDLLNKEMGLSSLPGTNHGQGTGSGNLSSTTLGGVTSSSSQAQQHHFPPPQLKHATSFRDIQSILSISSDDTTPGNSRNLSPVAVIRDDIFADLNAHGGGGTPGLNTSGSNLHPGYNSANNGSNQTSQPDSQSTTANSSFQNLKSELLLTNVIGGPGPGPGGTTTTVPSLATPAANNEIILMRKSFLLDRPPLPPGQHPVDEMTTMMEGGAGGGNTNSKSSDDDNRSLLSDHPHLLKSEETVPYPVPVIERGGGYQRKESAHYYSDLEDDDDMVTNQMLQPLERLPPLPPPQSHQGTTLYPSLLTRLPSKPQLKVNILDMNEVDVRTKSLLKTPKSSVYDISSFINTHRKLLETLVDSNPKSTEQEKTATTKMMENIIKPTLQEIKHKIDSNLYTPELGQPTHQRHPDNTSSTTAAILTAVEQQKQQQNSLDYSNTLNSSTTSHTLNTLSTTNTNAVNLHPSHQKELEFKKQQLENIWLLFATGFSALETILNGNYSMSQHNASSSNLLSQPESQQPPVHTGIPTTGSQENMLMDLTTLVTSFTMEELDQHEHHEEHETY